MTPQQVSFHRAAREELREAVAWYRERNKDVAIRLRQHVGELCAEIAKRPTRFPPGEFGTRIALVPKLPYYLVFVELDERIEIVAVCHARREPAYWRGRVEHD